MKRKIVLFPVIFFLAGCGVFPEGKQSPKEPEGLTIALWNVQNLFDGQENGNEYNEFLESAGWTAEKYAARLVSISQAVQRMVQSDKALSADKALLTDKTANTASAKVAVPDLIGFVEIENIGVLEDLARGNLSKEGYFWTAFAAIPGSSLGIGFLSRLPFTDIRTHSITVGKETAPRPVLEVRIEPRGKPLVFLLCHWKSKLGGDDATEALRRSSAKIVHRRLLELHEDETPVIIMGDLNENHDDFYLRSGMILCALLPDDPAAAALAEKHSRMSKEFLVLSGNKPPETPSFFEGSLALYSPWWDDMPGGSYYYGGKWETIDHFLLPDSLFDGTGWDFASCHVLNYPPFTTQEGVPNSYILRYGRGLSDHLPLLLHLVDVSPGTAY